MDAKDSKGTAGEDRTFISPVQSQGRHEHLSLTIIAESRISLFVSK